MNRDLVLSAIAAAALHGGLFFGFPKGKLPVRQALPPEKPAQTIELQKFEPDEPEKVYSDEPEKEPRRDLVPQQPDVLTTAKLDDFIKPYVITPPVDAPGVDRIPINPGIGLGMQKPNIAWRVDELDRVPRTRVQVAPVYPFEAKQRGLAGVVHVEFTVDENGRVSDPRIVDSTDRIFNEPTIAAVLKWRFEPGMRQNKAVRFRMVAPVVFNLNE